MKMFAITILLSNIITLQAFAGNGGRGGVPRAIDEGALKQFVLGYGLQISIDSYFQSLTLNLDKIVGNKDPAVASLLKSMIVRGLAQDVSAHNFGVELKECMKRGDRNNPEYKNRSARAWTQTGENGVANVGGKICFDIRGLVEDYKDLTVTEAASRFTALTFHELTHHYQNSSSQPAEIQKQEDQANIIGGYVRLHEKVDYQPVIKWAEQTSQMVLDDDDLGFFPIIIDWNSPVLSADVSLSCDGEDYDGFDIYLPGSLLGLNHSLESYLIFENCAADDFQVVDKQLVTKNGQTYSLVRLKGQGQCSIRVNEPNVVNSKVFILTGDGC